MSYSRVIVVACALLVGCGSTRVSEPKPETVDISSITKLPGRVEYSGNPLYLPRMLDASKAENVHGIVFRYTHDVSYDVPVEHGAQVFNPLLILGVPKSGDTLIMRGTLELLKESEVIKRYDKTLVLTKDKSLYSDGETLTDMRKLGLMQIRDHIDRMLIIDQEQIRNGTVR